MPSSPRVALHHSPRSRSDRVRWLLEEAGAAYEIVLHAFDKRTQKTPEFLALNPLGKVPVRRSLRPMS